MKLLSTIFTLFSCYILLLPSWMKDDKMILDENLGVADILRDLEDSIMLSKLPDLTIKGASVEKGREIVLQGFTEKPGGGKSSRQSSHFVCTSCHNIQREDPDLLVNDPLDRLQYTAEHGMPFLQGTTLYGAINRETYYNGDYFKKYGDLVKEARNNIRGAIHLCATECAQGRPLKDWEMESILMYLWSIDLRVGDINLSEKEKNEIVKTLNSNIKNKELIDLIKSKYLKYSAATFVYPPEDRNEGYPYEGNAETGKLIYENSCLHCHYRQKYSFFHLDSGKLSFKHLSAKAGGYGSHSIYQVIRWGVPTKSGKNSYMPQYTEERMSDEMVEDLRAFIEQQAQ